MLSATGSTKANELLAEAKTLKGEELTRAEKFQVAAPAYIPAVLVGAATLSCFFGANILNKKHQESLVSAYALLNESYKEYRNKVLEMYGEEASREIDDAIFRDKTAPEQEIELFYDVWSDRYFESTLFKVQRAEYELNRELIMKDYAYLNEWYEALDIPCVDEGWKIGWSIGQCMDCYWQPWIDFAHANVELEDGRKCHKVGFWEEPIEDFEDYY